MIEVYFDGLCLPKNPGGVATWGYVIYRDGKKIHEDRGLACEPWSEDATNNVAEYTGALRALEHLAGQGIDEPVEVKGDSKLVVEQSSGRWKVKQPRLAPLNARIRELFFRFPSLKFTHVPRERNREADALTNLAYAEFLNREGGSPS